MLNTECPPPVAPSFDFLKIPLLTILAVTLFALSLWMGFRGGKPTWGDETFTIRVAEASWSQFINEIKRDVHPPLYFLLAKLSGILSGSSQETGFKVRILSYGLHLLLILLTVHILREKRGILNASIIAVLLCGSASLWLFGPMMRYYSLSAIGATCATLLLLQGKGEPEAKGKNLHLKQMALYSVSLWIGLASSYLTAVILPAHMIYLKAQHDRETKAYWKAFGITIIVSLPLFFLAYIQAQQHPALHPSASQLILGTLIRTAFTVYSFALGEFIRPWHWIYSVPALLSALWLTCLSWAYRKNNETYLLWITFGISLLLGNLILSWLGIGVEFSASRLFFLLPLFLTLLGSALWNKRADCLTSIISYLALIVLLAVNLISTYNFSRRQDFIQSTYAIPWAQVAEDVVLNVREGSAILYDDDTLIYWLPSFSWLPSGGAPVITVNLNIEGEVHKALSNDEISHVVVIYSPRDITSRGRLFEILSSVEENFTLVSEINYLVEDETSRAWKQMLFRRHVEPVKKVLRVYSRR